MLFIRCLAVHASLQRVAAMWLLPCEPFGGIIGCLRLYFAMPEILI